MRENEEFVQLARQLWRAKSLTPQTLHDAVHSVNTLKHVRIRLLSGLVGWAESGQSSEHIEVLAVAQQVLVAEVSCSLSPFS